MPIKKTPNQLIFTVVEDDAVINIFTRSKKEHFTCSMPKLFDYLEFCIGDTYQYYQVHLTTYPNVAVHITGEITRIQANKAQLRAAIMKQLEELHDSGTIKR